MNKIIYFLAILLLTTSCKRQTESYTLQPDIFEFKISGTISGLESGQLYFSESNRSGDEISIPIKNSTFEYTGTANSLYSSSVFLDFNFKKGAFPIVIEPGEILLDLKADSLTKNSKVLSGSYSLAYSKAYKELTSFFNEGIDIQAIEGKKKIIDWIKKNSENYITLTLLQSWESFSDFMPLNELGLFLASIQDKKLKKSREYIQLYSIWQSKKNSVNKIGEKATNFKLQNINKEIVSFDSIAKNKLSFVEYSGSWCGNSMKKTEQLKPIYEKYKNNGFEIITIVSESKLDRWEKWIEKVRLPWVNLVELDSDILKRELSYSKMLFPNINNLNYLVDKNGVVIASNLSQSALNEFLMDKFEPEEYKKNLGNKLDLPRGAHILDKEQPINSLKELVQKLSGKPFLIDCWATWCSPCLDEFKYNKPLKTFLESKNMEVVYINFDQAIDDGKWINAIKRHQLKGYHIRINSSFRKDLTSVGFSGKLPTYLVVNSEGKVVENNAFRPSKKERLYNQIKNAIE